MSQYNLVVGIPFWNYEKGHIIADETEMAKALQFNAHHVTRIAAIPIEALPESSTKPAVPETAPVETN